MKYWSITYSKLPASGMALYPVMLFKYDALRNDQTIVRHEKIHFKQQIELLILPFYVLYLLHYLLNLLIYRNRSKAYFNICFEKEAYANDQNSNYLLKRRLYAWTKYL